jgi:hypothetical protein
MQLYWRRRFFMAFRMIADDTTDYSFARQHFCFLGLLCATLYLFVPLRALCALEMGQGNFTKFSEGVQGV